MMFSVIPFSFTEDKSLNLKKINEPDEMTTAVGGPVWEDVPLQGRSKGDGVVDHPKYTLLH